MLEVNGCWCGAEAREPFAAQYDRCDACGTLIYAPPIDLQRYTSTDEEGSFYGPPYWRRHVPEVLGLPTLEERARADLGDRAPYYLDRLLKYLAPGGRVLELGCAPGSLAFLMQEAGFTVTGIEMGEEIVEFVRRRFGVDVLPGPLEQASLQDSFDAVVMIDVLEHLPRPLQTLTACAELLPENGAFVIQTPCYRGEGTDWPMLSPAEHLYLYDERSVTRLLETAGLRPIEVTSSLFPYDMWVVASSGAPLQPRDEPRAGVSRVAIAILELHERTTALAEEAEALRCDQRAKQRLIEELSGEIDGLQRDQSAKQSLIERLSGEVGEVQRDQASKQQLIEALTVELDETRADQRVKAALIEHTDNELRALRADQQARQTLIERISAELAEVRADQAAKEELIRRLSRELQAPSRGGTGVVATATPQEASETDH